MQFSCTDYNLIILPVIVSLPCLCQASMVFRSFSAWDASAWRAARLVSSVEDLRAYRILLADRLIACLCEDLMVPETCTTLQLNLNEPESLLVRLSSGGSPVRRVILAHSLSKLDLAPRTKMVPVCALQYFTEKDWEFSAANWIPKLVSMLWRM